jgi:hypothetical protein
MSSRLCSANQPLSIHQRLASGNSSSSHGFFFLQAVADSTGTVLYHSVTTRRADFRPRFGLGPFSAHARPLTIILGRTTFAEIAAYLGDPCHFAANAGAHRSHYGECYYFGNPGCYRTFGFAFNQAGFRPTNRSSPEIAPSWALKKSLNDNQLASFRKSCPVNTYAISMPGYELEALLLGPDYDQVRVLSEDFSLVPSLS